MEAFVLNEVSSLLGDLVGSIANGNNPPICDPNVFATVVLDQFLEMLGDPGFIT
jgi:hypothetical protein